MKPKDNNIIQESTEDTPSGRPKRSAAIKASAKGIYEIFVCIIFFITS